jgi:hypothetical protein
MVGNAPMWEFLSREDRREGESVIMARNERDLRLDDGLTLRVAAHHVVLSDREGGTVVLRKRAIPSLVVALSQLAFAASVEAEERAGEEKGAL